MSALHRPVVHGVLAWTVLVMGSAVESFLLRETVQPWWLWALAGTAVITVTLLVRPRQPPLAVALVCALAGGYMVVTDGLVLVSYAAFAILVSYLVGRWAERALAVMVVAVAVLVVMTMLDGGAVGNMIVFLGLPWLSGRYLRQVAHTHLTEVEQAQLQERARIAQEAHDSLGHELSLIALRAGALEVAPGLSVEHRKAAGAIRSAAAAATERLGRIVGVLRDASEDAPLEPAASGIEDLVDRARESGMDVRLAGSDDGLSPVSRAAARRIVQEALTNAARHAPGSSVRVAVENVGEVVRLSAINGRPATPARPGATTRLGLAGLAEAARTARGTLRHGPTPDGGFEVVAELPAAGDGRRERDESGAPR